MGTGSALSFALGLAASLAVVLFFAVSYAESKIVRWKPTTDH